MATVTLTPVDPVGVALAVELADRATSGGGVGGWEAQDRPRAGQSVEWSGTPLRTLTIPVALTGLATVPGQLDVSIEPAMLRVEQFSRRTGTTGQPPIVKVSGPVRHLGLRWVLNAVEWDEETYTANAAGHRVQQFGVLTLLEFSAAALVLVPTAKARALARKAVKRPRTVVVRAGDTLPKIAARELHSAKRWKEIAKLNKIRDGAHLKTGRVLKLPA